MDVRLLVWKQIIIIRSRYSRNFTILPYIFSRNTKIDFVNKRSSFLLGYSFFLMKVIMEVSTTWKHSVQVSCTHELLLTLSLSSAFWLLIDILVRFQWPENRIWRTEIQNLFQVWILSRDRTDVHFIQKSIRNWKILMWAIVFRDVSHDISISSIWFRQIWVYLLD